jgi:copper chaperone CopZ
VKKVRSALTSVPGVISADVTMPDSASVKIDPSKADGEKLIAAVKKAGYSASLKKADKKK